MNYATIKEYDISNGYGVRLSLFVSGCTHRCPGCFNEVAWSFDYGKPYTKEVEEDILDKLYSNPCYNGLTLLGGEPLEPQNKKELLSLVSRCKKLLPEKSIWCYTGYTWDTIPGNRSILQYIDVLVDGPFILEKKDVRLNFRGSSNQRIIDVQKTLETGHVVELDY